ncbi:DUF5615 family PIN-like protein [Aerosakkonemataceae cyanobacterium BLCC-F154]|uniref:DUF5615 family PIN-like protein n=1 Tax=Floridaenema fluviatile BLCC-F154 TaxID=3153640 RepID=A0ABV4YHW6_9CYAN
MSLALYMDENVARQITTGLRQRGVEVLTVQEDGLTSFPDPIVLDRATELQRLLFTQDQDFLAEASRLDTPRPISARILGSQTHHNLAELLQPG